MIDFSIFLDFYFTKWLFLGSSFFGVCQLVNKLIFKRGGC